MFRRLAHFLSLIVAVQLLGGHWAVLQTVAWTRMFVENVQGESVTEALSKTFDGQHPCQLCQRISKERQSEKKPERLLELTKLTLFLQENESPIGIRPVADWKWITVDSSELARFEEPRLEPPRAARG